MWCNLCTVMLHLCTLCSCIVCVDTPWLSLKHWDPLFRGTGVGFRDRHRWDGVIVDQVGLFRQHQSVSLKLEMFFFFFFSLSFCWKCDSYIGFSFFFFFYVSNVRHENKCPKMHSSFKVISFTCVINNFCFVCWEWLQFVFKFWVPRWSSRYKRISIDY